MLKFHALNVREVRQESEDAIGLVLDVPADLAADYRAAAGQHVVLRSRSGTDEARRTYSLTGPAGALPLTLGVRIHPHGQFSRHLAQNVHAGDALDVMPPNGSFGAALATAEATAAGKSTGVTGTYIALASGCGIRRCSRSCVAGNPACGACAAHYGNRHTRGRCLRRTPAASGCFPASRCISS
jgi:ring-1,2-phenylacetyl-CoA epoxidase subunit PaaE